MIDVFDEKESRLLRRLFAHSVEDPLSLRAVDLSILGADLPAPDHAGLPPDAEGGVLALLSRIAVVPEAGQAPLDLADRLSAVMLVGYRRGFFLAAERAGLPTSDDAMAIVDLYPGLQSACAHYSLLAGSTAALRAQLRLASLAGRKELVHETTGLFRQGLQASFLQGYRTGALVAEALRAGVGSDLAALLETREVLPDDPEQNEALGRWLAGFGWDDLQREILRHQTTGFWVRLDRAARSPALIGLPSAQDGWAEAGDDYMDDVLIAIAQAGIRLGLRLRLQLVAGKPTLASDGEARLAYRVARGIALLARQWRSWHPAPSRTLRVRQVGGHLTAPTFASGAALGHMMAEALGPRR